MTDDPDHDGNEDYKKKMKNWQDDESSTKR